MRWMMVVLLLLCCGCEEEIPDDPVEDPDPYEVPDGATAGWYDTTGAPTTFPDDLHTEDDASTATGLRVAFDDEVEAAFRATIPSDFGLFEALVELDGFGTTAGVILRFTAAVDPAAATIRFVALDASAEEVPFVVESTDEGATLILIPEVPLRPATRYGVAVTGLLDMAGDPVWAAPDLHVLLHGAAEEPRFTRLHGRYADLLAAIDAEPDAPCAATVFTTQSLFDEDLAVAAVLAAATPALTVDPACPLVSTVYLCDGVLTADDFLGEDQHFSLEPGATPVAEQRYDIPVDLYLPGPPADGPYPVIVYGHGLGGTRGEGHGFARDVADLGLAVLSMDAPSHNDHPTNPDMYELLWIFEFFGLGLEGSFDMLRLRDHWRQAAWDKLQLIATIRAGVDIDGDGAADLDGTRVFYSGHSLGGIMGPQLLALDDDLPAAELSVPGGRVSDIVYRGEIFAALIAVMSPEGTAEGDVARFFPYLQATIERGDAANWATQVLTGERDVLVTMVIDDGIVPNECNRILASAMGLEHAPPLLQEVYGLTVLDSLPVSANLEGRTAVLYQYDEKYQDEMLQPADHEDAQDNDLGVAQLHHFWRTHLDEGVAEVLDPYEVLGL